MIKSRFAFPRFLVVAFVLCCVVSSAKAQDKVLLRMNLHQGQTFDQGFAVETKMSQTIQKQRIDMTTTMHINTHNEVLNARHKVGKDNRLTANDACPHNLASPQSGADVGCHWLFAGRLFFVSFAGCHFSSAVGSAYYCFGRRRRYSRRYHRNASDAAFGSCHQYGSRSDESSVHHQPRQQWH